MRVDGARLARGIRALRVLDASLFHVGVAGTIVLGLLNGHAIAQGLFGAGRRLGIRTALVSKDPDRYRTVPHAEEIFADTQPLFSLLPAVQGGEQVFLQRKCHHLE